MFRSAPVSFNAALCPVCLRIYTASCLTQTMFTWFTVRCLNVDQEWCVQSGAAAWSCAGSLM